MLDQDGVGLMYVYALAIRHVQPHLHSMGRVIRARPYVTKGRVLFHGQNPTLLMKLLRTTWPKFTYSRARVDMTWRFRGQAAERYRVQISRSDR